jgi:ferritin-like metal-binding protein YciE
MEITMQTKNLDSAFEDTLKDVYYAERQILKALPKMIRSAQSQDLKDGLEKHLHETEGQIDRLEHVFDIISKQMRGKTCPAIDGILEEGAQGMEEYADSPALDSVIAAAGQAVEHYEMARYGTLCAWASLLGYEDAVPLLQRTLDEEKNADKALSTVAETVNHIAIAAE